MDATMFYMVVILKIPILMLFGIVYWAWKQTPPEEHHDGNGGETTPTEPARPRGRGPHGEPQPPAPARVRATPQRQPIRRG